MKVSVVLAVHNGASTLKEAVQSVLDQKYRDFELVAVDDASTDGTPAVLAGIADPRLKVIRLDRNAGQSGALNIGIREAKGEYIARIDADDVWYPDRLGLQVEFMESHPDIALCGSWGHRVEPSGGVLEWRQPLEPDSIRRVILWSNPFIHSSVLVRKGAIEEAGGYDPSLRVFSNDYDLWLRIMRRHPAANVPHCLVRYRAHPGLSYRWRDEKAKLRVRWRALRDYGYPKAYILVLALLPLAALVPSSWKLWLRRPGARSDKGPTPAG